MTGLPSPASPKNRTRRTAARLLGGSLVLLGFAVIAAPTALADASCTATVGNPCEFECSAGDTITVSASGPQYTTVDVTGSCGGASAHCAGQTSCGPAHSTDPAAADGTGTCTLNSGNSGSCAAGGGGDPQPEPCTIEVQGICLVRSEEVPSVASKK